MERRSLHNLPQPDEILLANNWGDSGPPELRNPIDSAQLKHRSVIFSDSNPVSERSPSATDYSKARMYFKMNRASSCEIAKDAGSFVDEKASTSTNRIKAKSLADLLRDPSPDPDFETKEELDNPKKPLEGSNILKPQDLPLMVYHSKMDEPILSDGSAFSIRPKRNWSPEPIFLFVKARRYFARPMSTVDYPDKQNPFIENPEDGPDNPDNEDLNGSVKSGDDDVEEEVPKIIYYKVITTYDYPSELNPFQEYDDEGIMNTEVDAEHSSAKEMRRTGPGLEEAVKKNLKRGRKLTSFYFTKEFPFFHFPCISDDF